MKPTILGRKTAMDLQEARLGGDSFLIGLGKRVRRLRTERRMTRKETALAAQVSERHLANLELGVGNVSILVLLQIARALGCELAELVGDVTTSSPEWRQIRALLSDRTETELRQVQEALSTMFSGYGRGQKNKNTRQLALVGLRGAGKSTLGRMVAGKLGYPFIELESEIEKLAGCSLLEIHGLYDARTYRRYERQALENVLATYPEVVIAVPGSLVAEPQTLEYLLAHCYTVWVRANPEDHFERVMAKRGNYTAADEAEALLDLRRVLASREPLFAKADWVCSTSRRGIDESFGNLCRHIEVATAITGDNNSYATSY